MNFIPNGTQATVEILESYIPRVVFSDLALEKIDIIVTNSSEEVGWMCSVARNENLFVIRDVYLFEQEVHSTTTEISPDGMLKFAEEMIAQPNGQELYNSIKAWGHSHVNMAPDPSGQDENQMDYFKEAKNPYFIRMIANKSGKIRVDLYDYENKLVFKNIQWEKVSHSTPGLEEQLKKELKEKVKEKKPVLAKSYNAYDWYDENYKNIGNYYGKGHFDDVTSNLKNATHWGDLIKLGFDYGDAWAIHAAKNKKNAIADTLTDCRCKASLNEKIVKNVTDIVEAYIGLYPGSDLSW